jgi:hypothetical protein
MGAGDNLSHKRRFDSPAPRGRRTHVAVIHAGASPQPAIDALMGLGRIAQASPMRLGALSQRHLTNSTRPAAATVAHRDRYAPAACGTLAIAAMFSLRGTQRIASTSNRQIVGRHASRFHHFLQVPVTKAGNPSDCVSRSAGTKARRCLRWRLRVLGPSNSFLKK